MIFDPANNNTNMITILRASVLSIILNLVALITGCAQVATAQKTYSVATLRADFKFTKKQIEKFHPGIYWYVDKEAFETYCDSLYKSIDQPMTEVQFLNKLLPLFHIIRERHNDFAPSVKGYECLRNHIKTFPLSVKEIDGKLFVDKNKSDDPALLKGTQLLEINGRPIEAIINDLKNRMTSDGYNTTAILRYDIENSFWYYYYVFIDQSESFDLMVKKIGGNTNEIVRVAGITREEFLAKASSDKVATKYPLEFNVMDSLNTAIFTLNTFSGKNTNKLGISNTDFMDNVFAQLKSKPHIRNLIIDVRKNGGGNPGMEISMLKYLSEKRNKVYKRIERNRWSLFFKKDSTGKYYSNKFLGYTLEPNAYQFTGQVYLLISGRTYSAASIFSASMATFTNAIVIGEETGGGYYGTTGGNFKNLNTPNTKTRLHIPVIRFMTNVSGQPVGTGLLPDYHVTQTYEDFINNHDTEIEFTLKLIQKPNHLNPEL
jgi:hypothetical protein